MKHLWIYGGIIFGILLIIFGVSRYEYSSTPHDSTLPASALPDTTPDTAVTPPPVDTAPVSHYIEIIGGCDWKFTGSCVNVRSGAGTRFAVVMRLRSGIVLRVEPETIHASDGFDWYKVIQDKQLWHPERVKSDWYVVSEPNFVRPFTDIGDVQIGSRDTISATSKRIVVNLTKETLSAYDGDTLFLEEAISTGIDANPTTAGTFKIFRKTPSRYMQGPLPDSTITEEYDLPGVAWDMYFTSDGAVLHTAYWHDSFGTPMSHGCINQSAENAKKMYAWADLGTPVAIEE